MSNGEIIDLAIKLGTDCSVTSWMQLKKILLLTLPPVERTKFSTRHPKTKKQSLNAFERQIIENYEKKTGENLEIDI
jgi:hypothetical protein